MNKKIVKVILGDSKKGFFVDTNGFDVSNNQSVVIESEKGTQYVTVYGKEFEISIEKSKTIIWKIIRIANYDDKKNNERNLKEAKKALNLATKLSIELNLKMKFLNAYFTFDRSQLIFNFVSEDRVDFRELAKKLASVYKTRIELRQIGVRDKAKEIGGIGPCGRFLCCNLFLNDFESVSINMAKNQYISLKPDKINGSCGRLLCCLNYEDSQYTELKRGFPKMSSKINISGKEGNVISYDLFNKKFTIETSEKTYHEITLEEYESCK